MRAAAGQIVVEHVLLIGIVVMLLAALHTVFQRGTQGFIAGAADQMHAQGDTRDLQQEGLRYESGDRDMFGAGSVLVRESSAATTSSQHVLQTERAGAIQRQDFEDKYNYTRTAGSLTARGKNAASYTETVAHVEDKPKP